MVDAEIMFWYTLILAKYADSETSSAKLNTALQDLIKLIEDSSRTRLISCVNMVKNFGSQRRKKIVLAKSYSLSECQ
jgi:hypothetical protein